MIDLLIGLGIGLILALALAFVAMRRTEKRVRLLEQQSRTNERLAEIGSMTGGLAHEIKNPLSSVNLNIQLLKEDVSQLADDLAGRDGSDHEKSESDERLGRLTRRLGALAAEVDRLREILEDFLRFAGRIKLDRKPQDINALLDELAAFFEPQAQAANINLRTQLGAAPAVAEVDAALLKQAVLNLMINAVKATENARRLNEPNGGGDELIIRTERKPAPAPMRRTRGGQAAPDRIIIHVIDTGPGIPPDKIEQIFHPYYSTHKGGTGLGLPTTRRIVEEHAGQLTVHSEPGRGSDFMVNLPAAE